MSQQERTLEGMRITRTGRGMYTCQSESLPESAYSVDIMALDGLGSCTCHDFTFRLYPRWKRIRQSHDHLRCKHIRRVRNYVLDAIVQIYIEKEKSNARKIHPRRSANVRADADAHHG